MDSDFLKWPVKVYFLLVCGVIVMFHVLYFCFVFSQALELNQANTKALFRRAQAWQGLKEFNKAMVPTLHGQKYTFISL